VPATISADSRRRRAVGIVRVSAVKGRDDEGFSWPADQLDALRAACARDGLELGLDPGVGDQCNRRRR
jgi:hypothetical protein